MKEKKLDLGMTIGYNLTSMVNSALWRKDMIKWQLKNKKLSTKQKGKNILYLLGVK